MDLVSSQIKRTAFILCAVLTVLSAFAVTAQAQTLIGHSATVYLRVGGNSSFGLNTAYETKTFTVGSGVEITDMFGNQAEIDFTADKILIDFLPSALNSFDGSTFNGLHIVLNDLPAGFASA